MDKQLVAVNPAHLSKINWTQIVGAAASVLVIFGVDVPVEQQLAIVGGIQALVALVTVVFRTFMTAKES